jgi:predicted secreted Zn-dependent protease
MRSAWFAMTIWVGASPTFATGHLVSTTTYADHLVHGDTARAIYHDMNVHPIVDPDAGNALANLTHDHALKLSMAPTSGGQCRVSDLSFSWRFVITLPRIVDDKALDGRTRAAWRSFVARLRWHEEHHRAIFMQCGRSFVPAAAKLTGPCAGLEHQVQQSIDTAYAACMVTQKAFDRGDGAKVLSQPFILMAHGR